MLWEKNKISVPMHSETSMEKSGVGFPYPERHCMLYISSKYQEVLFIPFGKIDPYKSRELDSIEIREWPMNIGDLQDLIQQTLSKWADPVDDIQPSIESWHSFNKSKANSQHSFKVDYVQMSLTTDLGRKYGEGEVERILVKAAPKNLLEDSYNLVGWAHLFDTQLAQVVIDIFNACEKIRSR